MFDVRNERLARLANELGHEPTRWESHQIAKSVWLDAGAIRDRVRARESILRRNGLSKLVDHARMNSEFNRTLVAAVNTELARIQSENGSDASEIRSRLKSTSDQMEAIAEAIALRKGLTSLVEKLEKLEARKVELEAELKKVEESQRQGILLVEEGDLMNRLPEILEYLVMRSHAFANLMREIISQLEIIPVQALNSPEVFARVRFKVRGSDSSEQVTFL
jgi:hypothetical protein